jgi:alpha-N-arabinofuranosidase
MVNPALSGPSDTQVALAGGNVTGAKGVVLASSDIHAHNTFDQPNAVHLGAIDIAFSGGMLNVTLPPASVTKLEITLV